VLVAVPGVYATQHAVGFRWWWPTDWMTFPLGLCAVGLVLLLVPVRRSRTAADQQVYESAPVPLSTAIPNDHVLAPSPPQAVPALGGLPGRTATFTGRDTELGRLLDLLDPAREDPLPVQVSAVSGLGGVGKTELALQAAYGARERGWFPGGVLFVNLFGYDPARRVAPGRALDGLLRALGIPKDSIPSGMQDRARLYASVLATYANHGRPILVVIDNAWSAEQAEPLLPPAGAGRVVITSRHVLAELGARLIELKPLSTKDAVTLLDKKLRQANGPADTRAQDAAAARDLADLCGGLPLALQITGANLAADQSKSLRQMVGDLEEGETRLDELSYGDLAVRAVFELSYQAAAEDQQRLFRLLTVNPGPDISTDAAAATAGQEVRQTRHQLQALSRAHLIGGGADDRWRMHDLVRLYAEGLGRATSAADQRTAAEERLLHYYGTTTRAASNLISGRADAAADDTFTHPSDAVSWLKAEHANLTAAVVSNAGSHPAMALEIAAPLGAFLSRWRYSDEAILIEENALQIARTLHSASAEATALLNLGVSLQRAGRAADSVKATTESVALCRKLASEDPDRYERDLGGALANLAAPGFDSVSDEDRLAAAQEAVDIGRRWAPEEDPANPDIELAGALDNLSMVLTTLGQHSAAVSAAQEGVGIRRLQAARAPSLYEPLLAEALIGLAAAHSGATRYDKALAAAEEAIAIFRRLSADDLIAHGPDLLRALDQLKRLFTATGRPADAQAVLDEAARIQHLINTQPRIVAPD
jgi:tetratricopeptide (TPR) repeat protein